jgi:hypothetical protein
MPGGRPSRFNPEILELVTKLARLGLKDTELSQFFGVSEQTLNNWKHRYPKFLESLKNGRVIADANVNASLYKRANGYQYVSQRITKTLKSGDTVVTETFSEIPPDTLACIFWHKNRRRADWNDKSEIEVDWKGLQLFQINYNGNGKPGLPTGAGLTKELVGSTNPPDEAVEAPLFLIEGGSNEVKG